MRWKWVIVFYVLVVAATVSGRETIPGPLYGMEFSVIPDGSFMMGEPPSPVVPKSLEEVIMYLTDRLDPDFNEWRNLEEKYHSNEKPQHEVQIRQFYMMTTEVTQRQWARVMDSNPSHFRGDNLPVECVCWDSVQAFIRKLNTMYPGRRYRLPSEAEWEYACRAHTATGFCSGNKDSDLDRVGWFKENSAESTHPVGEKEPNSWGLYDMHGNVWEWCEDRYHDSYDNAPSDGRVDSSGTDARRVVRGGSSVSSAEECRACNRLGVHRLYHGGIIGFRLVFSP